MFKIVQITEANGRAEIAADLSWREALVLATQFCVRDKLCRREIVDSNGNVAFESFTRSDRVTLLVRLRRLRHRHLDSAFRMMGATGG